MGAAVSAAIVPSSGPVRQLDNGLDPEEVIRPDQVGDANIVARILGRILRDIAKLKRAWNPSRIDFEDFVVDATGTKVFRFEHKFGARVRFWPVDWVGAGAPVLLRDSSSDLNTLAVVSKVAGTLTLRVEVAG